MRLTPPVHFFHPPLHHHYLSLRRDGMSHGSSMGLLTGGSTSMRRMGSPAHMPSRPAFSPSYPDVRITPSRPLPCASSAAVRPASGSRALASGSASRRAADRLLSGDDWSSGFSMGESYLGHDESNVKRTQSEGASKPRHEARTFPEGGSSLAGVRSASTAVLSPIHTAKTPSDTGAPEIASLRPPAHPCLDQLQPQSLLVTPWPCAMHATTPPCFLP